MCLGYDHENPICSDIIICTFIDNKKIKDFMKYRIPGQKKSNY
jgi:hypothetical protein